MPIRNYGDCGTVWACVEAGTALQARSGSIAGIVALSLLAVSDTACGGATKTAASTPTASTAVTAVATTLAGKVDTPPVTVDGPIAAARFVDPYGIAGDAAGNVYATDAAGNKQADVASNSLIVY